MIMRADQADDAGARREGDRGGDQGAHRARSSTTSSRPRTSARWRASSTDTRSSSCPTSSARSRASGCSCSEFVRGRRLRGAEGPPAGTSATGSGRSCSASSSAACTATVSSPATRTRATSCCSTTAAWRSSTSGCSSAWTRRPVELELAAQRAVVEGDAGELHRLLAESGFLPEPERVNPENPLEFVEDVIWWYTTAEEDRADARDRHPRDDRELDPRSQPLPRDAPPAHAPRAPVRPAHGDADAGRPLASCARKPTGTGSRASGCTATSRSPSSAARRPSSTGTRRRRRPAELAPRRRSAGLRSGEPTPGRRTARRPSEPWRRCTAVTIHELADRLHDQPACRPTSGRGRSRERARLDAGYLPAQPRAHVPQRAGCGRIAATRAGPDS